MLTKTPDIISDMESDNGDTQKQYNRVSKDLRTNDFGKYLLCI